MRSKDYDRYRILIEATLMTGFYTMEMTIGMRLIYCGTVPLVAGNFISIKRFSRKSKPNGSINISLYVRVSPTLFPLARFPSIYTLPPPPPGLSPTFFSPIKVSAWRNRAYRITVAAFEIDKMFLITKTIIRHSWFYYWLTTR